MVEPLEFGCPAVKSAASACARYAFNDPSSLDSDEIG
jgi:hypothetical protein